ncbi:MAG: hypothetical protein E7Z84_05935 [Methanosphaera stadtmanae]|nr:hypothetical protein [Methanosphaera stadtmanae]
MFIKFRNLEIKIDAPIFLGIFLILLGIFILETNYIDSFVTQLLWILLEGSSEGKTVLFLGLLGSLFILSSLIGQNENTLKIYKNDTYYLKYLKTAIIILFVSAVIGLLIEIHIRMQYDVSIFTILTSMDPNTSTTSLMHSHAYKSVLGFFSNSFVPSHVNTGSSILKYTLPYALIIIPAAISIYFLGLFGLSKLPIYHRILSIISLSMAIIGLFDGGMFSQPFIFGLGLLLLMYYARGRYGFKYFLKPVVIIGYILLIGIIFEVGGSNMDTHTLTVINQTEPIDMSQYDVINVEEKGDKIVYTLNTTTPDKQLIREVFQSFKGKSDATFMTWNFFSYIDNPNTHVPIRQH